MVAIINNIPCLSENNIKTVIGSNIEITDALDWYAKLNIYGKSTQDGTPTPTAPFDIVSVGDSGSFDVKVCGKNLVDKSIFTFSNQRISSQTFLEILPNTNYTFSVSIANGVDGVIYIYDNDKNLINSYIQNTSNPLLLSITTPSNAKYLRINQWYIGNISSIDDIDIQLELGTIATEYEPYKGVQTLSINDTLYGIPVSSGGNFIDENGQQWITDEIDYLKGKKIQRIYKETFSGTASYTNNGGLYFLDFKPSKNINATVKALMSNKYILQPDPNSAWAGSDTCISIESNTKIRVYNGDTNISCDVIYALETPIETDINQQSLLLFEGENNVISDANLEIRYISK